MNSATKEQIIKKLGLEPLADEGGYFRLMYRSPHASAIYYLVSPNDFSALHRLKGDEIFHFYAGDPVEMVQISDAGVLKKISIGSDIMNGQEPQVIAPAGVWQGTRLQDGGKWALLGTTMAPRYDVSEFELGDRGKLLREFPKLTDTIMKYTR